MVIIDDSAQHLSILDYASVVWLFPRDGNLLLEALMRARLVIVVMVSFQNLPQMRLIQDQELI